MKRWILLTILVLFASACGPRADGPPRFSRNVHRIPDAVPKSESLSRIGNRPYTVKGKRYYPMKSASQYAEVGIASWYGTKFHGRQTSNGETFDLYGMTAAHKTLPLPTYVRVTNLKNKKSVIVRVNDRGPFHGDRLIDLSYAAAKKIDIDGVARVKIEVVDPKAYHRRARTEQKKKAPSRLPSLRDYYVQVGAFRNEENAKTLLTKTQSLADNGHVRLQDNLHRVLLGPLRSRHLAENLLKSLMSEGYKNAQIVTD